MPDDCGVEGVRHAPVAGMLAWLVIAMVVVPTLFSIELLIFAIHHGNAFGDFIGSLWRPGHLIRAGANPYPSPHSDLTRNPTDYPPFLLLLVGVPVSYLGFYAGAFAWMAVLTLADIALLCVLQIKDPRVWFVALCSVPLVGSSLAGNATPLVVLLAAIAWRYRDRWLACGVAVGAAISVKLFVFPLLFWLAAERRWRALAGAVASSVLFVFGSWALTASRDCSPTRVCSRAFRRRSGHIARLSMPSSSISAEAQRSDRSRRPLLRPSFSSIGAVPSPQPSLRLFSFRPLLGPFTTH
jgi:Glycosyltransferase family 87